MQWAACAVEAKVQRARPSHVLWIILDKLTAHDGLNQLLQPDCPSNHLLKGMFADHEIVAGDPFSEEVKHPEAIAISG